MVYEIESVNVVRQVVSPGIDYDCPTDGAEVLLDVIEDESNFFKGKSQIELTLGEASTEEDLALEQSIMKMRQGEVTKMIIGGSVFTLRLETFTSGLKVYEMSITEKWRVANWHKDSGVELFKEGRISWAFRRFAMALKYLVSLAHDVPESEQGNEDMNISKLRMLLYLNMSACHLKSGCYDFTEINATKALHYDPANSKALTRRGTALLHRQEYERSLSDLEAALKLEPENESISELLAQLRKEMSAVDGN